MRSTALRALTFALILLTGCGPGSKRGAVIVAGLAPPGRTPPANLIFAGKAENLGLGQQLAARTTWPSVDHGYVTEDVSTAYLATSDTQLAPDFGLGWGLGGDFGSGGWGLGSGAFSGLGGYGLWGYPGSYYGYGYYGVGGYQRQSDTTRSITIRR